MSHAMRCLVAYVRIVHRVEEIAKKEEAKRDEKDKRRKRLRWTNLMRAYRKEKQREI